MAKQGKYFCNACGYEATGWLGRCPACGSWNTMVEAPKESKPEKGASGSRARRWVDEEIDSRGLDDSSSGNSPAATSRNDLPLLDLEEVGSNEEVRTSSGIEELDHVLGGGFVRGSLLLVGGEPGIGKSTLLLQVCDRAAFRGPVLYVCGEESGRQIKLRAERLSVRRKGIKLYPEILFEKIADILLRLKPSLCIVDSIQTLYSEELSAAPGSVSQVREVTAGLLRIAKRTGTTIILVGHVTKEGAIAGPRVLEHMVDTVLYFEGEESSELRMLRAVKNRFGATNQLGLFMMKREGLLPVEDASAALLEGRPQHVPGSAITATMEGNRPLLIEIQALLNPTPYGAGQRMTQGFDRQRLSLLLALLEKQFHWELGAHDAFINLVGGIRVGEPGIDLAVLAAILSSFKELPLRPSTLFLGEVGLTGECRRVSEIEARVREAEKYGFAACVLPSSAKRALSRFKPEGKMQLIYIDRVQELLDIAFDDQTPDAPDGNRPRRESAASRRHVRHRSED